MRAFGDSVTPLAILIFACLCNVVFDIVLVLEFQMGVLGVAAATVASQSMAAVVSFWIAYRRIPYFRFTGLRHPDWGLMKQCMRLGLPIVGQNIGAGKKERVRQGFQTGMLFIAVVSMVMLLVMQLFGRNILSIFVKEQEVIETGAAALRITSCFFSHEFSPFRF